MFCDAAGAEGSCRRGTVDIFVYPLYLLLRVNSLLDVMIDVLFRRNTLDAGIWVDHCDMAVTYRMQVSVQRLGFNYSKLRDARRYLGNSDFRGRSCMHDKV